MNTVKHTKYQTHRYISAALAFSTTLLLISLVRNYCLIEQVRDLTEQVESSYETIERYKAVNNDLLMTVSDTQATTFERLGTYDQQAENPPCYFDVELPEDLQDYIWSLCREYDIEEHYALIFALIKHESQFDATACSSTDDWGLMQINTINHEWLSEELGIVDFLDPYENVHGGIHILASLLHKYDVADALMAYNMGEYGASKLWQSGVHTTAYSDQILDYYYQFIENI